MVWADHLISFYKNLNPPKHLPDDIQWLHPQKTPGVMPVVEQFYRKYYSDQNERTFLLGINPGRFGAGVTGINFTGPKQLADCCHIDHGFKAGSELSAEFIYDMINEYGGPESFYGQFFIGSVCPLGFVQGGKNINYYDNKELLVSVEPFIIKNLDKLISYFVNSRICFSIGGEKNFRYLQQVNQKKKWFKEIVPLPHPRFIMQYKRKEKKEFIKLYLDLLKKK